MTPLEAQLLRLLAHSALNVYRLSLNNTIACHAAYALLSKPRPGDLVIETSRGWISLDRGTDDDVAMGIGRLVSVALEPMYTPEEWKRIKAEDGSYVLDAPIPTDTYWTIERLTDGQPVRWSNACFVRVLEGGLSW